MIRTFFSSKGISSLIEADIPTPEQFQTAECTDKQMYGHIF